MRRGRRLHERIQLRLPVEVEHDSRRFEATSRNISLGGMYLVTAEALKLGEVLRLRFRLPELDRPTECEAAVRWQGPDGYGVQFGSLRALDVWGINQLFRDRGTNG